MIAIRPIRAENVATFRSIRLAALRDSPMAFGSLTYARESQFDEQTWTDRATKFNSERSAGFLAFDTAAGDSVDASDACGIVGAFVNANDPTFALVVSMWVAPTHRRRGVARLLVNTLIDWAERIGLCALKLQVTENNSAAIALYTRLGFVMTGRSEPYPNDTRLNELEMELAIGGERRAHGG